VKQIHKFLQLSWRDQLLLIHATFVLAVVVLGLRVFPWITLQRQLLQLVKGCSRFALKPRPSTQQIGWSVKIASLYVPKATCLPKALTAQLLLIQHTYPANLQIGIAKNKEGILQAHAWVSSENSTIIGMVHDLDHFLPLSSAERPGTEEYVKAF
jgi:hypothetical protein